MNAWRTLEVAVELVASDPPFLAFADYRGLIDRLIDTVSGANGKAKQLFICCNELAQEANLV